MLLTAEGGDSPTQPISRDAGAGQASLQMSLCQVDGSLAEVSCRWTWHYCSNTVVMPRIRMAHIQVSLLCDSGSSDTCTYGVKLNPGTVKPLVYMGLAMVFFEFCFLFTCLFLDSLAIEQKLSWTHYLPTSA